MIGIADFQSRRATEVIVGVDTHKDEHVAVAIDGRGARLAEERVPVTTDGYKELDRWARNLGVVHAFGIEGTGSYGAGIARFLTRRGHIVIEVNRPDRSVRFRKGKSDPTDAEMAARSVLSGVSDATPKSGEGEVEMIRMLKNARNSAVKARTQAGTHSGYIRYFVIYCRHLIFFDLHAKERHKLEAIYVRMPGVVLDDSAGCSLTSEAGSDYDGVCPVASRV